MKIFIYFILLVYFLKRSESIEKDIPNDGSCWQRKITPFKIVCVCNEKYCDKIKPIEKLQGKYLMYTSSKDGLRFDKQIREFQSKVDFKVQILVNKSETYQKIFGYGGAFTDSSGMVISSLSEEAQQNLINSYYSKDGIEYTRGRLPMGGNDFSDRPYSLLDEFDPTLESFQLAEEDLKYKIPFIKMAQKLTGNQLQIFVEPWSSPTWMKDKPVWGGNDTKLLPEYYQTWADYYIKYFEEYKKHGIDIWGATVGNEGYTSATAFTFINSINWNPINHKKWIKENFGPTIRNSNFKDIKIIALSDQSLFLPWLLDYQFKDKEVKNYIDGIGTHWYVDYILSPESKLQKTHEKYPDKFIMYTEACSGESPFEKHVDLGSWARAERYLDSIILTFNNWVVGWTDWNLALNLEGGPSWNKNFLDAPIIVNSSANEFYKQPIFYALGHVSKFVPRDSLRIKCKKNFDKIETMAALRPDGGTVIVISNKNDFDVPISIKEENNIINMVSLRKSFTSLIYYD